MSNTKVAVRSRLVIVAAIIVLVFIGFGIHEQTKNSAHLQTNTNSQQQVTQISYNGKNGVNAYNLLKQYASVQAKHYSFGYLVTSIDGSKGTGPKYWTFYVNGKESNVGASSYITKDSDKITWKLQ